MSKMYLGTSPRRGTVMWGTNPTTDTVTPLVTLTEPTALAGVMESKNHNLAKFIFFTSAGADGEQCDAIVYGWSKTIGATSTWIPFVICKVGLTVGGKIGIASGDILHTDNIVDTISFTNGDDTVKITSGVADEIASLTVDLEGAEYVQVLFDFPGSNQADDMNAVCQFI